MASTPSGTRMTSSRRVNGPERPAIMVDTIANGRPLSWCGSSFAISLFLFLLHHRGHRGRGRGDVSRIGAIVAGRRLARQHLGLLDQIRMVFDETSAEIAGTKIGVFAERAVVADHRCGSNHDGLSPRGPR